MKRFLYKPILRAIDEREKRVAAELADADAKRTDATKAQGDFRRKNEEFDRERDALVAKALDAARAEGERLVAAAREAADAMSATRSEALRRDARTLHEALARRTQEVVFEIVRKALSDLATTSLEERLVEVFTRRLREMSPEAKEQLAEALTTAREPAVVRSAFPLAAPERAALQGALSETLSSEVKVRFEVAPQVISGIELRCGGRKVGWSLKEYLTSLEHGVAALLGPDASSAGAESDARPASPIVAPAQAVAATPEPTTPGA